MTDQAPNKGTTTHSTTGDPIYGSLEHLQMERYDVKKRTKILKRVLCWQKKGNTLLATG